MGAVGVVVGRGGRGCEGGVPGGSGGEKRKLSGTGLGPGGAAVRGQEERRGEERRGHQQCKQHIASSALLKEWGRAGWAWASGGGSGRGGKTNHPPFAAPARPRPGPAEDGLLSGRRTTPIGILDTPILPGIPPAPHTSHGPLFPRPIWRFPPFRLRLRHAATRREGQRGKLCPGL